MEYSSFEKELAENGKLVYTNVGVSMMPLIREKRDVILMERLDDAPKRFDVVLFRRDGIEGRGHYVLHRVLRVRRDGRFLIAGDHDASGEIVEKDHILGRMTSLLRDGKPYRFSGFRYWCYLHLWCAPYRLRFFFLRAVRKIRYLFSALRYKLFGK